MTAPDTPRSAGFRLGLFAALGLGLVALVAIATREPIARSRDRELREEIAELVPPGSYDNDPLRDQVARPADEPALDGYRARRAGAVVAVILLPTAPDGYNGAIRLAVAIRPDGSLIGVRVLAHRETPGLGDRIELEKSPWIRSFEGRSLQEPERVRWKVRRDGGAFDQFAGATITPRAVVGAVYRTLEYFQRHKAVLLEAGPQGQE